MLPRIIDVNVMYVQLDFSDLIKPEKEKHKAANLGQRLYVRDSALSLIVRWSHVYKT